MNWLDTKTKKDPFIMSALTSAQRQQLQAWLTETGELYVDYHRVRSAGWDDTYFFDSVTDLETLITNEKWPNLVVTIFRRLQFPIRGVADNDLLARALQEIPEGKEFEIKNLAERYPSCCECWGRGHSHAELRSEFREIIGERVGIGLAPNDDYIGTWSPTKIADRSRNDEGMKILLKRVNETFQQVA